MDLSTLLNDQLLYSWGEKDIFKKVIILSSFVNGSIDSMREVLTVSEILAAVYLGSICDFAVFRSHWSDHLQEATEKCVSIEFLLLEQKYGHLFSLSDDLNNFVQQICDLENCSVNTVSFQGQLYSSLFNECD